MTDFSMRPHHHQHQQQQSDGTGLVCIGVHGWAAMGWKRRARVRCTAGTDIKRRIGRRTASSARALRLAILSSTVYVRACVRAALQHARLFDRPSTMRSRPEPCMISSRAVVRNSQVRYVTIRNESPASTVTFCYAQFTPSTPTRRATKLR